MVFRGSFDSIAAHTIRRSSVGALAIALWLASTAGPALVAGQAYEKFSANGRVTTSFDVFAGATAVALQTDGKIVAAGYDATGDFNTGFDYDFAVARYNLGGRAFIGSNYDFALARYRMDGTLDGTFGKKGKRTTPIGPGDTSDGIAGMVLLSSHKLIAVGGSGPGNGSSTLFALARYGLP